MDLFEVFFGSVILEYLGAGFKWVVQFIIIPFTQKKPKKFIAILNGSRKSNDLDRFYLGFSNILAGLFVLGIMLLLTFSLTACGQSKSEKIILGKSYAEKELKSALTDKSQHNVIDKKTIIIKDSLTAINIAEPILFSIYGKDNITKQRPYEIFFINNHWILIGTLPKGYLGGTFLIIIDSRDSKIVRITHGK